MRSRFFLITLLIALTLPMLAEAKRSALVIGNSRYSAVSALPNPVNDAAAVAKALEAQGFEVLRLDDLDRDRMYDAFRTFRDFADEAEIALVYYAGHGIEIAGRNYLVPVDAQLVDERDAAVEMIDMQVVLNQISGASRMKMVVLDACRNNPFVARMKRAESGRNVGRGLANISDAEADTLIAYAAAAGEITPDGPPGANSPFTQAFLSALEGPPQDVRRLLGTVRDAMRLSVPGAAPFVYSSLGGGEYVINPESARPVPEPAPTPPAATAQPDPRAMVSDFAAADRIGSLEVWEAFLARHADQRANLLYGLAEDKRDALRVAEERRGLQMANAPAAPAPGPEPTAEPDRLALLESPADTLPPAAATAPSTSPVPVQPSREEAVRALQDSLAERGCYSSAIDGLIGPGSISGVERFANEIGVALSIGRDSEVGALVMVNDVIAAHPGVTCPRVAAAPAPRSTPRASQSPSRTRTTTTPKAPQPSPTAKPEKGLVFDNKPNYCPQYGRTATCFDGSPIKK